MKIITRRKFIRSIGLTVGGALLIPKVALSRPLPTKSLFMHNIHTGEYLKTTFYENGAYVQGALKEINKFFRDRITNEIKVIDPKVLDLMHKIYKETESSKPLELVSGYRCLNTNASLRKKSKTVAEKSYHMKGMAADFYIPGVQLKDLRKLACSKGAGGVGYYPKSGFIHIDIRTGAKKRW